MDGLQDKVSKIEMQWLLNKDQPANASQSFAEEVYEKAKPVLGVAAVVAGAAALAYLGRASGIGSLLSKGGAASAEGATAKLGATRFSEGLAAEATPSGPKSTWDLLDESGFAKGMPKPAPAAESKLQSTWDMIQPGALKEASSPPIYAAVRPMEGLTPAAQGPKEGLLAESILPAAENKLLASSQAPSMPDIVTRAEKLKNVEVPPSLAEAMHGMGFTDRGSMGLAAPIFKDADAALQAGTDYGIILNRRLFGMNGSWQAVPNVSVAELGAGFTPVLDLGISKGLLMLDDAGIALSLRTMNGRYIDLVKSSGNNLMVR